VSGHEGPEAHRLSVYPAGALFAVLDLARTYVRTMEGRVTFWSTGAERLYGWTRDEAEGRLAHDLLRTHLSILGEAPHAAVLHDGEWCGELRQRRRDGTQVVVSSHWVALRAPGGPASHVMEINTDVTVLESTRARVVEQEAQLRSILETMPDAAIVIDERGMIRSFSAAAERTFGYSAKEVLGQNVDLLMPSPYREQHDAYIDHYLRTGERRIIGVGRVVTGQRKDGSTVPLELAVGEVQVSGRRLFVGFARDLTERQRSAQRLQELHDDLARVARICEIGQMSAAVADELNQPLAAIANYMEAGRELLARSRIEAPGILELFEKASAQSLRAGEIIRGLRELLERHRTSRRPEAINKVVEDASALALVGAKECNIRVQFRLNPDLPPVDIDRVQIQQVVLNLVRNAMEAMRDGDKRVLTIGTARLGHLVEVSVRDTGPGLPDEVAAQIFQPFVTTKENGLGIGLSICRTIIDAHGGAIRSARTPMGETVFAFTLPIAGRPNEAP